LEGLRATSGRHIDGGEMELVAGAGKPSQAQPLEAVMGHQVREAHLEALSFIARFDEGLGSHDPARHIPGVVVKIARDFPRQIVRTALRFEWADVAVELGGAEACTFGSRDRPFIRGGPFFAASIGDFIGPPKDDDPCDRCAIIVLAGCLLTTADRERD
jgi:hypothetical protein